MRQIIIDIGHLIERGVVALEALASGGGGAGGAGDDMATIVNVGNGCGEVVDLLHAVLEATATAGQTAVTTVVPGVANKRIAVVGGRVASPNVAQVAMGKNNFTALEGNTTFPAHAYVLPPTTTTYAHFILSAGEALSIRVAAGADEDVYVGGFIKYVLID